jgi:hypothetical protein
MLGIRRKAMATGKYLSLEEARQKNKLDKFAEKHPSTGNEKQFDMMLDAMVKELKDKK